MSTHMIYDERSELTICGAVGLVAVCTCVVGAWSLTSDGVILTVVKA